MATLSKSFSLAPMNSNYVGTLSRSSNIKYATVCENVENFT